MATYILGDVGFYALLGVQYDVNQAKLQKAYKRAALLNHPDRHPDDPHATERFQEVMSARQILEDPSTKEGYDRILQLRTFAHQCDDPSQMIDPFLVYSLDKINGKNVIQSRLLKVNFVLRQFSNWKKDELRKSFDFQDLASVVSLEDRDFEIHFKNSQRPYHYRACSMREKETLCQLFLGILNDDLAVKLDDRQLPPKSLVKGQVEKRGQLGKFSKRFVMIGTTRMLIFRERHYRGMVNCMSLHYEELEIETPCSNVLVLESPMQSFYLRFESEEMRDIWEHAIRTVIHDQRVGSTRTARLLARGNAHEMRYNGKKKPFGNPSNLRLEAPPRPPARWSSLSPSQASELGKRRPSTSPDVSEDKTSDRTVSDGDEVENRSQASCSSRRPSERALEEELEQIQNQIYLARKHLRSLLNQEKAIHQRISNRSLHQREEVDLPTSTALLGRLGGL